MRNEYFMKEYWHFNGDYNVIFNLIEVNTESMTATWKAHTADSRAARAERQAVLRIRRYERQNFYRRL